MREDAKLNILVSGPGKNCGRFLEILGSVHGVTLTGLLDLGSDPSSIEAARRFGIPLVNDLGAFEGSESLDLLINATSDPRLTEHLQQHRPEGALVVRGPAARFVRLMAAALRKKGRFEQRYLACKREVDALQDHDEGGIIGKSPEIAGLRDLIQRVSPTPTTVLLLGETGTGKDLAARCIHKASHLAGKPFVSINCTALTPSLMESELFGYRKGSFTGAEQDKIGLLEEADGGTLFLDEIGDMQIELQAKMLRFLQTGEIRRVGSNRTRRLNVRIIAATNRDIEGAIEREEFRRDLYYRFNTFSMTLPPLRERREDIPYLAYSFVTRAERKLNRNIQGISERALGVMTCYDWPGNVRELQNVIERAAILCSGDTIDAEDLAISVPETARARLGSVPAPDPEDGSEDGFDFRRKRIMDAFERKELERYLANSGGNVSDASRQSGIPRRTFYRKLKKHGLAP